MGEMEKKEKGAKWDNKKKGARGIKGEIGKEMDAED